MRIVHCFRSPVGGIFRHVRDLVAEQIRAGHEVGIICDSNTGGQFEAHLLNELRPSLELGLIQMPMSRSIGPGDIVVGWKVYRALNGLNADVIHTHGAKGGALGRIAGTFLRKPVRFYCPHGGSIHYDKASLSGKLYFLLERGLERLTDGLIFVSQYEQKGYEEKIGTPRCDSSFIYNGLRPDEFAPIPTKPDATDFVYVGMMRDLKGPDVMINALSKISERVGRNVTATFVGDGPDLERYKSMAKTQSGIRFYDPMPAREAFSLGKTLIIPSRAESLPYILLEAIAAEKPLIATCVGGIPEVYGEYSSLLINPGDVDELTSAMSNALVDDGLKTPPVFLQKVKEKFSSRTMAQGVMQAYEKALLKPQ